MSHDLSIFQFRNVEKAKGSRLSNYLNVERAKDRR